MKTRLLKGSCHCKAVTFTVKSAHFFPYQLCYCSICRKTQGGGGYSINLGAQAETLKIKGKKNIKVYEATKGAERNFCGLCGSALWLFSAQWPDLVHPFASAIDSLLPRAPVKTHIMLDFAAPWVEIIKSAKDLSFKRYPTESIKEWHERVIGKLTLKKKRVKKRK